MDNNLLIVLRAKRTHVLNDVRTNEENLYKHVFELQVDFCLLVTTFSTIS